MNKDKKQPNCLKSSVLSRIDSEQLSPKSRLFFQSQECFVWFLWLLSVIIGAFAVAVSLFVMMHHQYAFYEATHNNFLTFMVEFLPYLWLFLLGLMLVLSIYNFRHTAKGYRYSILFIVSSSLVLSLAGGAALHLLGFGFKIDKLLGDNMMMYESQAKQEQRLWQQPEEGRLIGKQVLSTLSPTTTVIFEDISGQRWQLLVSELNGEDLDTLKTKDRVKLIGQVIDGNVKLFYACGAFPELANREMKMSELSQERRRFIERVYELSDQNKLIREKEGLEEWADLSFAETSPCSKIRPVQNMPSVKR